MSQAHTCILKVENVTVNRSGRHLLHNISFSLNENDSLAITGPSGSGKTILALALAGKIFYNGNIAFESTSNVVFVEQQYHFKNLQNTDDLYYQQRFNSYDTEETETVARSLGFVSGQAKELIREMNIEYFLQEPLIQLSNGEHKKLQLLKARLEEPDVLIMDQPFIGLDKETRAWLKEQLEILRVKGVLIIIITSPGEIPEIVSKVIALRNGEVDFWGDASTFRKENEMQQRSSGESLGKISFPQLLIDEKDNVTDAGPVIEMKNVTVQYGDKLILENINWQVMSGERWMLSGPNGAGKSTLLSLITADNPKAYANSISLFGRKRGSGESIWDIKKKIGFISPELHLYFNQSATCFETIASGLFDTIGLFRQISDEGHKKIDRWTEFLQLKHLEQKRLYEISTGEQRAVLLARALIKNPPLLILDEPCQGLDKETKDEFLEIINSICLAGNKTLVFVSHYENEKPDCISHYIRLDHGRVVEIYHN